MKRTKNEEIQKNRLAKVFSEMDRLHDEVVDITEKITKENPNNALIEDLEILQDSLNPQNHACDLMEEFFS